MSAGVPAQDKTRVSDAETKAEKAVEAAGNANEKMTAADAFLKKYPKSSLRQHVGDLIADQVFAEKDANQRLALAQRALTIFTAESEVAMFKAALIDAYATLTRFDEAFAEGATFLAKNPENVQILVNLAIAGTEQAKQGNTKYVPPSRLYGMKAIELLEADKKPADMDAGVWDKFKRTLPQLYQEMAIISLMQQNSSDALGQLEKAVKLNAADPFNYLLASVANDDYQKVAESYKNMPDSKAKDDLLVKVNQLMDKVIDLYAHAAALSEGKAGYEKLHDQTLLDMTPYYKFRHKNSTDGMQKLIDGYKLP
jgi:tetratricopeptide (TPR) repeat protein